MASPRLGSVQVSNRRLVPDGFGPLLVVGVIAYLFTFLRRGWVPHDEGLIGQSADFVLRGAMPHADFDDAYTGGLSLLYAAVFREFGTDLLNIRWLMGLVFSGSTCCIYAICRRYATPVASGLATCVAVTWSFANYFAGLPSWWLTACALLMTWGFIRHLETDRLRYLVLAALSAGVALFIKQTGLYLILALVMATVFVAGPQGTTNWWLVWSRRVLAVVSLVLAGGVLGGRILEAEGVYLFLPLVAVAAALWHGNPSSQVAEGPSIVRLALVAGVAAIPFVALAVWYAMHGRLWDLIYGGFILPRTRLSFASRSFLPAAVTLLLAWPVLVFGYLSTRGRFVRFQAVWWILAMGLAAASLVSFLVYQAVWQAARTVAMVSPMIAAWWLYRGLVTDRYHSAVLFMLAATTSWVAMNQFPFGAPVYFSYAFPFAVVTTVGMLSVARIPMRALVPVAALVLTFAVVGMNRGYVWTLGERYEPVDYSTAFGFQRAHLRVDSSDAALYRRVVERANVHAAGRPLMAGPDCPEVYFLSGVTSPTGTMYEFMSRGTAGREAPTFETWRQAGVVVVNHQPLFSPRFDDAFMTRLRTEFPSSEHIGRFELRWR